MLILSLFCDRFSAMRSKGDERTLYGWFEQIIKWGYTVKMPFSWLRWRVVKKTPFPTV